MNTLLKTKKDAEEFLFWVATLQSEVLPKGCCLYNVPEWLMNISNDFVIKHGGDLVKLNHLTDMTHKEIGDLLLKVYTQELNNIYDDN